MSQYEDFLAWRRKQSQDQRADSDFADTEGAKIPFAEKEEVAVEMEPLVEEKHVERNIQQTKHFGDSFRELPEDLKGEKFIKLAEGRVADEVTFAWRDISLEVPVKTGGVFGFFERKTGENKKILNNVSGFVEPGDILFIMGPSGAGKSTMLDTLADRVKSETGGVQWLNGKLKTEEKLKEVSKYVQQEESLLGALTVKEVFETAAMFYQPESSRRAPLVDAVVKMLGLENQLNTKIGDVFFRGLSGGQKRRVTVGIELIAQPSMLFLDEPTSGLDSASAFSIMASLRGFAKATKTPLLITIHQPSELLFELGDKLLLLSGGHEVYFGPLTKLEGHFNALGFECPPRTSIAEWLLDLINRDFGDDAVVDKCVNSWPESELKRDLDDKLKALGVPFEHQPPPKRFLNPLPYRTNQFIATWALFRRGFYNALRSPAVIWLRMAMYFFLSILIGTVWLQLGNSAKVINSYNGALFYTTAFMIFMSISVLPMYLEERNVFIRERSNASYGVTAYLLSHFVFELPFVFLLSLICSSTVYWLVGLFPDPNRFFIFVANLFMGLMVAESIMILISAIIPYFIVGLAAGAFVFGAFMCVMGYFAQFNEIGWWWKWMRYIAVHYFNFSTFMSNQHEGQIYTAYCPSITQYPCYPTNVIGGEIIVYYELEGRVWVNFLVQLLMIIIFRVCAGLYLHFFVRGKK